MLEVIGGNGHCEYSDIVLNVTGGDPLLVTYKESEKFTTKIKTVANAIRDLIMIQKLILTKIKEHLNG